MWRYLDQLISLSVIRIYVLLDRHWFIASEREHIKDYLQSTVVLTIFVLIMSVSLFVLIPIPTDMKQVFFLLPFVVPCIFVICLEYLHKIIAILFHLCYNRLLHIDLNYNSPIHFDPFSERPSVENSPN